MKFLLDTNFIIGLLRKDKNYISTFEEIKNNNLYISPLTVTEIYAGCRESEMEETEDLLQKVLTFPLSKLVSREAGKMIYNYSKRGKKIYIADNGFIEAKAFQSSKNHGRLIENLVFIELLNRGHRLNLELFYYKTRNQKEIDFIVRRGIKIQELIQVSYNLKDSYTEKREINSLLEASEELNCKNLFIITWDTEKKVMIKKKKIIFIPLWKWLLNV